MKLWEKYKAEIDELKKRHSEEVAKLRRENAVLREQADASDALVVTVTQQKEEAWSRFYYERDRANAWETTMTDAFAKMKGETT